MHWTDRFQECQREIAMLCTRYGYRIDGDMPPHKAIEQALLCLRDLEKQVRALEALIAAPIVHRIKEDHP